MGRYKAKRSKYSPPLINQRQVVGLFFSDDLAVGATTIGLKRSIKCVKDFCKEWGLKTNVDKTKTVVLKKGGKLSRDENLWLDGEEIELVEEIKYLDVVLDSRGK
jgi:hypothetical protein